MLQKYRAELNELGLKTSADLEKLVKPLIRNASRIIVKPPSEPPQNSRLISHFGDDPYFEKGEKWPESLSGKPLDFIFQIFNEPGLVLPEEVKLIQFYYDWDVFPRDTENAGWQVKIYKDVSREKSIFITRSGETEKSEYCELDFIQTKSLPDWEGIDTYESNASKLSCVLNEDKPWEKYKEVVSKLIGEQDYQSQLGGYPQWVQGENTPEDENGNPMELLFQIDSEENAGLNWGDTGLIYVFYDAQSGNIDFKQQCF